MRYQDIMRNRGYRDRQSRQFSQACNRKEDGTTANTNVPFLHTRPSAVKFEILMEYQGKKVIITDHAREQNRKRNDFVDIESMKDYFMRVVDGLVEYDWKEYNQEVFVYSKSYRRGCIVAYRREFKHPDDPRMHYAIVTVYPLGSSAPMKPDTEVIYVA